MEAREEDKIGESPLSCFKNVLIFRLFLFLYLKLEDSKFNSHLGNSVRFCLKEMKKGGL